MSGFFLEVCLLEQSDRAELQIRTLRLNAASLLRPHVNDSHIRFSFQCRSLRLTSPWHPRKPQQGSRGGIKQSVCRVFSCS